MINESLRTYSVVSFCLALLCGSALISSCSAWDIIGAVVKPSPGIAVETEIVVGDKQQEIASGAVVGKKQTTTNTAETLTQTTNNIDYGRSIWDTFLLMLMAFGVGWLFAPSGRQMWIMLKSMRS